MPTHSNNSSRAHRGLKPPARYAPLFWCVACALLLGPAALVHGAEIHSNGSGGGLWSDPETWHGSQVPGAADTVVIAMRDHVVFDGDDRDRPSCRGLYLDPEAVLSFRQGRRRHTLTVAGPVESYGTIRIDGTEDRRGMYELVLAGETEEQRRIRLLENAALLVYGYEQHREDDRNARITAASLAPGADANGAADDGEGNDAVTRIPARIVADDDVMFDLHHARVHDATVELANLDNTGASGHERLNIIGNRFTGASALSLTQCDTPAVRENVFETEVDVAPQWAISIVHGALADVRGNTLEGPYDDGIFLQHDTSSTISENRITGAGRGVVLSHSEDTSLKDTRVHDCATGVLLSRGNAIMERVAVERAEHSFSLVHATAQLTDCSAEDGVVPDTGEGDEDGDEDEAPAVATLLRLEHASANLVNSPIEPDQIEHTGNAPNNGPYVETMQYVIVRVMNEQPDAEPEGQPDGAPSGNDATGQRPPDLPAGLQVRVQTAEQSGGVPEGRADLNVRNSPAPVSDWGLTPLPRSQRALAVRSWRIDNAGAFRQAPFYDLIVEAPEQGDASSYQALTQQLIEPQAAWFRPEPNRPEPTVEVTLP